MTKFDRKKLQAHEGYLGTVDLSGTISTKGYNVPAAKVPQLDADKPDLQNTQPIDLSQTQSIALSHTQPLNLSQTQQLDLSQTQPLQVIIQEPQVIHVVPKWVKPLAMAMACVTLFGAVLFINKASSDTPAEAVAISKTHKEDQGNTKTFTAELKKTADATATPYTVTTEVIGGGYIIGITTYNPDKATEMYMDYALSKPEQPQDKLNDETSKKIESDLSKDLPTINKTIVVKDPTKVTMETYKHADNYHTILLYDGKPFAYVSTDKDNIHTNYVTSYYVTDVAAK